MLLRCCYELQPVWHSKPLVSTARTARAMIHPNSHSSPSLLPSFPPSSSLPHIFFVLVRKTPHNLMNSPGDQA